MGIWRHTTSNCSLSRTDTMSGSMTSRMAVVVSRPCLRALTTRKMVRMPTGVPSRSKMGTQLTPVRL